MNTNLLRFVIAGLLSFPALLAMADDQPAQAAPPPAAAANDESSLRQQLSDANDKLATALRSYSLVDAENAQLKTQATASGAEIEKLRKQITDLEARVAAPAPVAAPTSDAAQQLAEANDKLATALRSYTLLQAENDELKAAAAKNAAEAQAAASKVSAEASAQLVSLSDQLRQVQSTAAALATENAQLRVRLGLSGPPSGSALSAPVRPGTAAATAATTPPPAPTPVVAPAPETKTYVVAEGDSLAKIALKLYADAGRWPEIYEANRDQLKNANVLPVGVKLRIP